MHVCLQTRYIYVDGLWCSRKLFLKSTQNSSDADLVKDIKSANKITICYFKKFSLYFIFYQLENLPG